MTPVPALPTLMLTLNIVVFSALSSKVALELGLDVGPWVLELRWQTHTVSHLDGTRTICLRGPGTNIPKRHCAGSSISGIAVSGAPAKAL